MKININKHQKILIILGIIFFFIYAWPVMTTTWPQMIENDDHFISSWPDSLANNFFINQFIENNTFTYNEPLNSQLKNIVHPRSVNIYQDKIVPMGFLGILFIFGLLGKIVGSYGILLLTSFMAVMAVYFFYLMTQRLFNKQTALLASILLLTMPPFIYYASLPMLPNILFLSLLIVGFYFYTKAQPSLIQLALAGLFIGLALVTRLVEFVLVFILLIIPYSFFWKKINWKKIVVFLAGLALPLILMLTANYLLYGNALHLGYFKLENSQPDNLWGYIPSGFINRSGQGVMSLIKFVIAPFGFSSDNIFHNFYIYFIKTLWPYFTLASLSLIFLIYSWFKKKINKKQVIYLLLTLVSSFWLIIYYGNWLFDDTMTLKLNTIGISYMRYWLPLFVIILPAIAYSWQKLISIIKNDRFKYGSSIFVLIMLIFFSIRLAYYSPGDGLLAQRNVINNYYQQYYQVSSLIEPEAILINDREDKVFFPEYSVIMFNGDYNIFNKLTKVVDNQPVYYLSRLPKTDMIKVNQRINELKLKLVLKHQLDNSFALYALQMQ